jgi:hypothetical protein
MMYTDLRGMRKKLWLRLLITDVPEQYIHKIQIKKQLLTMHNI